MWHRYRPTYPDELFDELFSYAQIDSNSSLLEIGIGTGQATLPFLKTGCQVTAIELGDRLSAFVAKKFRQYRNIEIINDDFITTPIQANTFDLIYCATAFHWLPVPDGFKKVMSCLKKGGVVALFWNHPFPNRKNDTIDLYLAQKP